MNQREKEAYLREYSVLKSQGKPFFPYAVAKDGLMGCLVILIIIGLSIIFGAELGPKANAATTTYTPRPEWYFFFLFELLRVIKPPNFVGFATIGVPTLAMILLFLLPFYDRGPERHPLRRPIATTTGILVILAMGYLTYLGATAGPPSENDIKTPALVVAEGKPAVSEFYLGRSIVAQSECEACHKIA
ncbi:MAG TPA: cytochrome B, partial [Solirubrobacteraceae bacterium]|nr:cytochrome B [Solirubrobacteraceae bacterium]